MSMQTVQTVNPWFKITNDGIEVRRDLAFLLTHLGLTTEDHLEAAMSDPAVLGRINSWCESISSMVHWTQRRLTSIHATLRVDICAPTDMRFEDIDFDDAIGLEVAGTMITGMEFQPNCEPYYTKIISDGQVYQFTAHAIMGVVATSEQALRDLLTTTFMTEGGWIVAVDTLLFTSTPRDADMRRTRAHVLNATQRKS